jgi:hypothetical protein
MRITRGRGFPAPSHSHPRPNNNFLEGFTDFCEMGVGVGRMALGLQKEAPSA